MNNKLILYIIVLVIPFNMVAQVGINTTNPQAMLDIRSQGSTAVTTAFSVKNNNGDLVFGIRDDGRALFEGVANPKVLLDLRNGNNTDILGIGNNSQTYSVVGEGAVKYDTNTRSLYFADNTAWKRLSSDYIKAFVVADIPTAAQAFANNTTNTIGSWSILSDLTASFNPTTGIFTARRGSIYFVTINITFDDGSVVADSQLLVTLRPSSGLPIKCITTYNYAGSIPTGVQCSGNFNLNLGDTLYTTIWHDLGVTKYIKVGYSNLTIVER